MNSMAFTPEEVEAGLLQQLLDYLINFGNKSKDCYQDIHVTTDSYCIIVEWESMYYDDGISSATGFKFVDDGQVVMTEYKMPDDTYQYFQDEADYKEALETYKEKNLNSDSEVILNDKI